MAPLALAPLQSLLFMAPLALLVPVRTAALRTSLTVPAAASSEAQSMQRLLLPTMLAALPVGEHRPELHLFGTPRWLGGLLRAMGDAASVSLNADPAAPWSSPRLSARMSTNLGAVTVIAADDPDDLVTALHALRVPVRGRVLLWTAGGEQLLPRIAAAFKLAPMQVRVVLAGAGGRASLHKLVKSHLDSSKIAELDRWAASSGWDNGGVTAFDPPCFFSGSASSSSAAVLSPLYLLEDDYVTTWMRYADVILARVPSFSFHREYINDSDQYVESMLNCSYDLLASLRIHQSDVDINVPFGWGHAKIVAVVPFGMGKGGCMAHSILSEFGSHLWAATALALVTVAACLYWMGGGTASFFDALAPLLGQAPPSEAHGPRRLVLGGWLLVCVVLSAAYSGILLPRMIGGCASENIGSSEELADTNLTVYTPLGLSEAVLTLLSGRLKLLNKYAKDEAVDGVLNRRDSALILGEDSLFSFALPRAVHVFPLPHEVLSDLFIVKKQSPFERALRTTLGRVHAAGVSKDLEDHFKGEGVRLSKANVGHGATPLNMRMFLPAFLVLGAGHLAATVYFLVELALARRAARPPHPHIPWAL